MEKMNNRKPIYRLYIDETGNSDLKSSTDPNHRFLSLTGVIFNIDYIEKTVNPQLEALKKKYFNSHPDDPVILHRADMVNKRFPFHILKDIKTEKSFNTDLITLLESWDFTVITVLIDKLKHNETYSVWKYDPYHYSMAILLERYCFFLEDNSSIGDIIAESRGGKEDKRLKESFNNLYQNGTNYINSQRFQNIFTSSQLKIKNKSNNISGLQIADIIAHPSRREILLENKLIEDEREIFGDKIVSIIKEKYYKKYGNINGYGKKLLP